MEFAALILCLFAEFSALAQNRGIGKGSSPVKAAPASAGKPQVQLAPDAQQQPRVFIPKQKADQLKAEKAKDDIKPPGGGGGGSGEAAKNINQAQPKLDKLNPSLGQMCAPLPAAAASALSGNSGGGGTAAGDGGPMEPLVEWNGCDKSSPVQGGYGGSEWEMAASGNTSYERCGKAMMSPQLLAHMQKNLVPCLQHAGEQAGISGISTAFIHHMGVFNNRNKRNSNKLSEHAYGRAIDIASIDLRDASGNIVGRLNANVGAYDGKNKTMYDGFLSCWQKSLQGVGNSCGGEGEHGAIGHSQCSHGLKNDLHNDHIHLVFAHCKGSPY